MEEGLWPELVLPVSEPGGGGVGAGGVQVGAGGIQVGAGGIQVEAGGIQAGAGGPGASTRRCQVLGFPSLERSAILNGVEGPVLVDIVPHGAL